MDLEQKIHEKTWAPLNALLTNIWAGPLLVFACALVIRLIVLVQFKELNPLFENPVVDAWKYDTLAKDFIRLGTWPERNAFFQPPAYPFFLSLVYRIFGESFTWVRIIQAVIGSLSCVFVCLIGTRLHSQRAGLTAGLVTALYGPLIFFDLDLLAPVIIVFWSTLGLLLLITCLQQSKKVLLPAAGLCFGTALISWPIIGLACALTAALVYWTFRAAPRKAVSLVMLFSLGVLIPIAPVFLYNILHGKWVLVSTNGGINFYIGNNPNWQETVAMHPGYPWEKIVNLPYHVYGAELVEKLGNSALFFQEAKKYILSQPADYIQNQFIKLYQIGFGYEIMRNTDLYFFKQYSPVLNHLIFSSKWLKFPFGVLFPFALFGIFFSFRTTARENKYLLGYLVSAGSGLLLFFVTARYRVVLVPVLAFYAAIGFWELLDRLRRGNKSGPPLLFLLVCIGLSTNLDIFGQQKLFESSIYQAQAPFTLGRIHLEQGKPDMALPWLKKSIETDPTYPDAWIDLGRAKYALGDVNGAVEAMYTAIKTAPDYPLPYFNLGVIYDNTSLYPMEAIKYYRQFLSKGEAYFDTRIRGPKREKYARQRLANLLSQNKQQEKE